jgi:hypothetical protein
VSSWNLSGDNHFDKPGGSAVTPEERSRMNALCAQMAIEKDQDTFIQLVQELNDLMERKVHRLNDPSSSEKRTDTTTGG